MKNRRIALLREKFSGLDLDSFFVSKPENLRYLSGFTGSNGRLLVTEHKTVLLTDFRYKLQARDEVIEHLGEAGDVEIKILNQTDHPELPNIFEDLQAKKVGFEANFLTFGKYQRLTKILAGVEWVPTPGPVERLRMIKDDAEIEKIAEAASIGDKAFSHILPFMKPGVAERKIALEIEFFMRNQGAEKASFDVIVASGEHSATSNERSR